jgi:hypothetical protein
LYYAMSGYKIKPGTDYEETRNRALNVENAAIK